MVSIFLQELVVSDSHHRERLSHLTQLSKLQKLQRLTLLKVTPKQCTRVEWTKILPLKEKAEQHTAMEFI